MTTLFKFPLASVSDYVHILYLNTTLRVGWKTIPNLNFKLKFQTQTWISKTKIFPVLPGNPGFWEIDSKGKKNESNEAISWYLGKAMRWSKSRTESF